LVLKIITSEENKDYKNSVITSWKITEKRLNNYLRNKDVIYKKE
jgi:phage antirepressor YoqD-like protein